MKTTPREAETGFTLIELMISLGLFALIATAGLALVQGVMNVQGRTEARFDRMAELQRTMFVITSDIDQIAIGKVAGEGNQLTFRRVAPGTGGQSVEVNYVVAGGALVRSVGPILQPVLTGAAGARWQFYDQGRWLDRWPADPERPDRWPRAIAVELQVVPGPNGGPQGTLRRTVVLPTRGDGK